MKNLLIIALILVGSTSVFAQQTFELKNASKYFDIKIKVAECDETSCKGEASFSFYKKGGSNPYQIIEVADTYIDMESGQPAVNQTLLYDKQSVVNIDDFNFDGMEDVAISDGTNGSYGMPSYEIYLSSKTAGKFVYNKDFSELAHHLGMFTIDKEKKTISTFDKSGCCWHITEEYKVVNNRPVKILSIEEDATIANEDKVKITTQTLVGGKWKTSVKYLKREE